MPFLRPAGTGLILGEQEALGLDLLTDGEQRRESFVWYLPSSWQGVDAEQFGEKEIYRGRVSPRPVPRITAKLERKSALMVDDLRFAKGRTGRPLKMALPGPMTVIDSTLNEAYADEGELAMDRLAIRASTDGSCSV